MKIATKQLISAIGATLLCVGCSTVTLSEKGALAGIEVQGASGQNDRTLCVGNEGSFLFGAWPICAGNMAWREDLGGISKYDVRFFCNQTSVQALTDVFYRYAERDNCDVVGVIVDQRTDYPVGLSIGKPWALLVNLITTEKLYVTGVLRPRTECRTKKDEEAK